MPDVRTLVGATQGGADRRIRLTIQPDRTSLAEAMRILDRLKDPAAEKWGARSAHRAAITPAPEHGLVSIFGPDGLLCANAVGTFAAASAGQNWDRLASAAHMWALKLVDNKEFPMLLFPGATLVLD